MKFILLCSQSLLEFRIPELNSIATLFGLHLSYPEGWEVDLSRPYVVIDLLNAQEAILLGSRAICIRSIWEYWADEATYEELHAVNKEKLRYLWPTLPLRWKFTPQSYGTTIPHAKQVQIVNLFSYMPFEGPIDIKRPEFEVGVMEEWFVDVETEKEEERAERGMRRVWLGRKIRDGQRHLIQTFDLKKRQYIGTTSMDSEVSLIMANQVLASSGKVIWDPFAGTGSMLLTCSQFGALTIGGDIDPKQLRGKGKNIATNAKQYGLEGKILDCAVMDVTQHAWRTGGIFDGIITDPPYGVRAGAKRLGRNPNLAPYVFKNVPGHGEKKVYELPGYQPPSHPWEMTSVITTLLTLSLYLLKIGGRLTFFLPTDNSEYKDIDIPLLPGFELISNSSQDFGKWARRLVTFVKINEGVPSGIEGEGFGRLSKREEEVLDKLREEKGEGAGEVEGHRGFRERYFNKFEKEGPGVGGVFESLKAVKI